MRVWRKEACCEPGETSFVDERCEGRARARRRTLLAFSTLGLKLRSTGLSGEECRASGHEQRATGQPDTRPHEHAPPKSERR